MMRNMFFARDVDPAARLLSGEQVVTEFSAAICLTIQPTLNWPSLLCQSVTSSQVNANVNSILHEFFL